jgi:hypothetical protein
MLIESRTWNISLKCRYVRLQDIQWKICSAGNLCSRIIDFLSHCLLLTQIEDRIKCRFESSIWIRWLTAAVKWLARGSRVLWLSEYAYTLRVVAMVRAAVHKAIPCLRIIQWATSRQDGLSAPLYAAETNRLFILLLFSDEFSAAKL